MPNRTDPWPAGTPSWIDVAAPDVAAAAELYASVFGWTVVDTGEEFGHYRMASIDGFPAAGIGQTQPGAPAAWTVYVATDDIHAAARAVTDNGGHVLFGPESIPGTGVMAIVTDPTGAAFGLWQAGGHIGAGVYNQAGALLWTDTNSSDVGAARAFYGAVFGWTFDEVEGAAEGYATYKSTGDALGGLGGLASYPPGTPSHWLPYIGVGDTDQAAEAITAAGGKTVVPPSDSPFGRMSIVQDPWGATFTIMSVPDEGYPQA